MLLLVFAIEQRKSVSREMGLYITTPSVRLTHSPVSLSLYIYNTFLSFIKLERRKQPGEIIIIIDWPHFFFFLYRLLSAAVSSRVSLTRVTTPDHVTKWTFSLSRSLTHFFLLLRYLKEIGVPPPTNKPRGISSCVYTCRPPRKEDRASS